MGQIVKELRRALRSLLGDYAFTLAVVASLTLGIGANSAIFTVVNALLLRSLPYGDPDRLILVEGSITSRGWEGLSIAPAEFQRYRENIRTLENLVAFQNTEVNVSGSFAPTRVRAARVAEDFFDAFGLGQSSRFNVGGSGAIDENSVILGHRFWTHQLGSKPDVAGSRLRIDDRTYVVSGVAPKGFDFPGGSQLWMPLPTDPGFWSGRRPSIQAVGLLRSGASLGQAESELSALAEGFSRDFPDTHSDRSAHATDLRERLVGGFRGPIRLLSVASVFVLLIAVLNTLNLSLTRTLGRSREFAVRSALGATRVRLTRQLLTESFWLCLPGAILGLGLGQVLTRLLVQLSPTRLPYRETIGLDGWVLIFTGLLSMFLALLIGVLPAMKASGFDLVEILKQTGQTGSATRGQFRLQRAAVAVQVAAAATLLIGAGLMTRSLSALRDVDPGFEPADILSLHVVLPRYRYPDDQHRVDFANSLLESLRSIPGVASAGLTSHAPLESAMTLNISGVGADGSSQEQSTYARAISGDYLSTLKIPLIRGRAFKATDLAEPAPVIINQTLARRLWPGQPAIGSELMLFGKPWQVVGVAGDVKHLGPAEPSGPELYLPFEQLPRPGLFFMIKSPSASDPAFVDAVRSRVRELDGDLPITSVRSGEALLAETYAQARFNSVLMNVFSGLALSLAFLGVFSTIQRTTLRRRREIAVRLSVGARRVDILARVLSDTLGLVAVGLGLGLALAWPGSGLLADQLFQVNPWDPPTLVLVAALLVAAGLGAGLRPALHAMHLEPVTILKAP